MLEEHAHGFCGSANDAVVPDPREANLRLERVSGFGDDHDVGGRTQHVAGELGEAALKTDVDRTAEMAGREIHRIASVEHDRAPPLGVEHALEGELGGWLLLVEDRAVLPVATGVEREVLRSTPVATGRTARSSTRSSHPPSSPSR